jgi:hypothetical protein
MELKWSIGEKRGKKQEQPKKTALLSKENCIIIRMSVKTV